MNGEIHPIDRQVGQRVRIARLKRKMSQTQLATMLGVTFQQLQKYEKGANRISASRLFEIAKALELDIGSFFREGSDDLETAFTADTSNGSFSRLDLMIMRELSRIKEPSLKRHVHGILAALVEGPSGR